MKKLYFLMGVAIMATIGSVQAQVTNRALEFTSSGTVDCGSMPQLDNLSSYSIQFWLNPSSWTEGSKILSRGENFVVSLGPSGKILFTSGITTVEATSADLKTGEWSQVTLICDNGVATTLVNGEEAGSGNLGTIPSEEDIFMLGGNYSGLVDEVRLWDEALNEEMKTFDYFTNNTLNKWNPMWENLIVYYKMDQENCPNLVDYKGITKPDASYNNHGILSEGVTRVVANNNKMPYLVNSAYTNNPRFYDRIIPRDQYLLSNDLIILGADVFASDGHIETKTPNNHCVVQNGEYLSSYEGREGVLSLDGKSGTYLVAPSSTLKSSNIYTFEGWLYLEEWTPGAYLMRKENDSQTQGLAIYLGEDSENPTLIVRIDGKRISSKTLTTLPLKKWFHVGISPAGGSSVAQSMSFFVDDRSYSADSKASDGSSNVTPSGNEDINLYIGENLKGKLDDVCVWNKSWDLSEMKGHLTTIPVPSITMNVKEADMSAIGAYYRFDDSENLGHSSHSQDEWLNIMKGAYDGHAGVHFYISIQGYYTPREPYGNWRNILGDAAKRAKFVEDLVEISKPYDGVELDLEWIEQAAQWTNYGVLCDEIEAALPEGKKFRISLHNSYTNFPAAKRSKYDGFTFQQYGPQESHYGYIDFKNKVNNFINLQYPKDKIMTSYSTTTSQGKKGTQTVDIIGVRKGALDEYVPAPVEERNYDVFTDATGATFRYMGPMQVYARAKYTREQNLQGIFYWDMGNDGWNGTPANPVMHKYNMAKYCSYGINANNDTIVNKVEVLHFNSSSVKEIKTEDSGHGVKITPAIAENEITVTLINGLKPEEIRIYSPSGNNMMVEKGKNNINISSLSPGVYMLTVTDIKGESFSGKFIKQ